MWRQGKLLLATGGILFHLSQTFSDAHHSIATRIDGARSIQDVGGGECQSQKKPGAGGSPGSCVIGEGVYRNATITVSPPPWVPLLANLLSFSRSDFGASSPWPLVPVQIWARTYRSPYLWNTNLVSSTALDGPAGLNIASTLL